MATFPGRLKREIRNSVSGGKSLGLDARTKAEISAQIWDHGFCVAAH
jgi:hypothetical protein